MALEACCSTQISVELLLSGWPLKGGEGSAAEKGPLFSLLHVSNHLSYCLFICLSIRLPVGKPFHRLYFCPYVFLLLVSLFFFLTVIKPLFVSCCCSPYACFSLFFYLAILRSFSASLSLLCIVLRLSDCLLFRFVRLCSSLFITRISHLRSFLRRVA